MFDVDLAAMRVVLIANNRIVIEAREDRRHIVPNTRVDVTTNDSGQIHGVEVRKNSAISRVRQIFIVMRTISIVFVVLLSIE